MGLAWDDDLGELIEADIILGDDDLQAGEKVERYGLPCQVLQVLPQGWVEVIHESGETYLFKASEITRKERA